MNGYPTLVLEQINKTDHDIILTLDYWGYETLPYGAGGILVGFLPIYQNNPTGNTTLEGLNYSNTTSLSVGGVFDALLGIGLDFGGTFALSSTLIDGVTAQVPNAITIRGSQFDNFPLIYTAPTSFSFLDNSIDNLSLKRIRIRLTDFSRTLYIDGYDFKIREYARILTFPNSVSTETDVKIYCTFCSNTAHLSVVNVNLNAYTDTSGIAFSAANYLGGSQALTLFPGDLVTFVNSLSTQYPDPLILTVNADSGSPYIADTTSDQQRYNLYGSALPQDSFISVKYN